VDDSTSEGAHVGGADVGAPVDSTNEGAHVDGAVDVDIMDDGTDVGAPIGVLDCGPNVCDLVVVYDVGVNVGTYAGECVGDADVGDLVGGAVVGDLVDVPNVGTPVVGGGVVSG